MKNVILVFLWVSWAVAGEFKIDFNRSWVEAIAESTLHDFKAVPETYDCKIQLTEDLKISAVSFSFRFEELKTGKEKRDREMRRWLKTDYFPELTYVMTTYRQEGSQQIIEGTLSFHNRNQQVRIPIQIEQTAHGLVIKGKTSIDVTDFGLKKYRAFGFLSVKPVVRVHFQLLGALVKP